MTRGTDYPTQGPGAPLYGPESAEPPASGTEERPGGLNGPQTGAQSLAAPAVTAEPAAETRILTLRVTGAPDLPNAYGPTIAPHTLKITYEWQPPAHRQSWFTPGRTIVQVTGARRLASGRVGRQEITRDLYQRLNEWPAWVSALVAAHMPQGWDQ
ncbi:hypothetical protein RM780_04165 [Streptomyces sp. DSM 44917]|uniref:Uncharacterized protein n=1 Tax=Streptomyces boetiae TaxID=3075541 RepID=A0ABU2L464_9ACTN|nr:hypothetical protein [Streptomyces sp. DSM 44917]MDT0306157.1 hypothetical protein [Streptomyces sp. DSM 44917]